MKALEDCSLYTFIDLAYTRGRSLPGLAAELCKGGSDLIQLRAKDWTSTQVEAAALEIQPILRDSNVGLVVNDHPQVAIQVGAEFCHLGQEDFFDGGFTDVNQVRNGRQRPAIGLSSHAPEQAARAIKAGADYVAVGPVFATATKPTARAVTLDYVKWAAANVRIPWFAIGGINLSNLDEVKAAGARRICVVSAILNAPDVAEACRRFKERLRN